jgi:hypothetical protein
VRLSCSGRTRERPTDLARPGPRPEHAYTLRTTRRAKKQKHEHAGAPRQSNTTGLRAMSGRAESAPSEDGTRSLLRRSFREQRNTSPALAHPVNESTPLGVHTQRCRTGPWSGEAKERSMPARHNLLRSRRGGYCRSHSIHGRWWLRSHRRTDRNARRRPVAHWTASAEELRHAQPR